MKGKILRLLCQEGVLKKGAMIQEIKSCKDQNQLIRISHAIIVRRKDTLRPIVGSFKRCNKAQKVIPQKDLKPW